MSSIPPITTQPQISFNREDLVRQVQGNFPQRPMQCSLCCGRTWDVIDSSLCCLNLCPASGAAYALVTAHPYFAAFFGASALGNVIAHGLVRKYGSLAAIVEKLTEDEGVLSKIFSQFQESVNRLEEDKTHLAQTVSGIEQVVSGIAEGQSHLTDKVKEIVTRLESERKSIEELKKQNSDLKARVEQLGQLTFEVKGKMLEFKEQNKTLSASLGSFSEQIAGMDTLDQKFKADIDHLDKTFDEDIADFAKVVLNTQHETQTLSEMLCKQNLLLSEKIQQLQGSTSSLEETLKHVTPEDQELLIKELSDSKKVFLQMEIDLETLKKELTDKEKLLQKQNEILAQIQAQFTQWQASEDRLEKKFSPLLGVLGSLQEQDKSLEERISKENEELLSQLSRMGHMQEKCMSEQ
jgi:DNA repair exonuclease SbcCD ATPase subunit